MEGRADVRGEAVLVTRGKFPLRDVSLDMFQNKREAQGKGVQLQSRSMGAKDPKTVAHQEWVLSGEAGGEKEDRKRAEKMHEEEGVRDRGVALTKMSPFKSSPGSMVMQMLVWLSPCTLLWGKVGGGH